MNAKSFSSRIIVLISVLLLSFGAFQAAYAAEGELGAAGVTKLAGPAKLESASADKLDAQAVIWRTITTPEQLRVLTLENEGFGPGYYKIGADFTLGDQNTGDEIGTCALLSGRFVIDFNGHTVQSSCENLATFTVQGANVTFMDSKASSDKVSVNSYGIGCIEVRDGTSVSGSKGSATIVSGNYLCQKFTEAGGGAVFNCGGTLAVNGGAFRGSQAAISTNGGATTINGGTFYGGYPWALLHMGGDLKIVRGEFYGGKNYYGATFALGAVPLGNPFDMGSLLASGSTWNSSGQVYYSGTSYTSAYPGASYPYAATTESAVVVSGPQKITASNVTKTFGSKAFNLNAKTNGDGKLSYSSSNAKVATVNSAGKVTVKGAGAAKVTIRASKTTTSKAASKTVTIKVNKAPNTLAVKGLTKTVSVKKVARKAQTTKKAVKVSKNKGSVTFAKASGSKKLSINKKTGKVTVKKGTNKGLYRIKVKVMAAGNANYAKGAKTATVTVKVK